MPPAFDSGYEKQQFRSLCENFPMQPSTRRPTSELSGALAVLGESLRGAGRVCQII